jgi:Mrp family chromosome partitioning ATPase
VAAQLAATAARSLGLPVVLVDCNCANPGVHRAFDVPIGPGLRDALAETGPVREFLQPSSVANLSLLTAGTPGPGTGLTFNSPNLSCLLGELNQEFNLVIVDLPAIGQGVAAGIGALLDGLVLVVEAEKVRWEVAQRTTASLRGAGANLLGVVMNKRKYHVPDWLYDSV